MATTFYPTNASSEYPGVSDWTNGPTLKHLSLVRGSGAVTSTVNTIANLSTFNNTTTDTVQGAGSNSSFVTATPAVNFPAGTLVFITRPLNQVSFNASVITINIRGSESANQANYGGGAGIWLIAPDGTSQSYLAGATNTTEFGTTEAARNINTAATGTLTLQTGGRIAVVFGFGSAGGASTSGRTASFFYGGASGATGDSFITFPQTITELHIRTPTTNHQNPAVL